MEYKKLIINEEEILNLYADNGWSNYTNHPDKLFEGIRNSLESIGVYDQGKLVGLVRIIGDKTTIIYVLDILILKAYQRQGIGTKLLNTILDKYHDTMHVILSTDQSEMTKNFYEKLGFKSYQERGIVAYSIHR